MTVRGIPSSVDITGILLQARRSEIGWGHTPYRQSHHLLRAGWSIETKRDHFLKELLVAFPKGILDREGYCAWYYFTNDGAWLYVRVDMPLAIVDDRALVIYREYLEKYDVKCIVADSMSQDIFAMERERASEIFPRDSFPDDFCFENFSLDVLMFFTWYWTETP